MPRVVPSDVVKAADRLFPDMVKAPNAFPGIGPDAVPRLIALADLVHAVAPELITLNSEEYAALLACVAYMRALGDAFQAGLHVISFNLEGYEHNPVATVRGAMAKCPDEAAAPATTDLPFITDVDLRDSIRRDISAANSDLAEGKWKSATVLSGSVVETLLLWALQEKEKHNAGVLAATISALLGKALTKKPGSDPEAWGLHEYVEVAAHLGLIEDDTAKLVRLAKDFRNLIHPGRAARLGQKCDRATALGALAAAEAVARDLATPSLPVSAT